jgi:hypothetical protein
MSRFRSTLALATWIGFASAVCGQTTAPAIKLIPAGTQISKVQELRSESEISDKDAKDPVRQGSFFKSYPYKMEAGKYYRIDLVAKEQNLDPYLRLEDPAGKVVGEDDDGGGFPNSRLIYQAKASGEHKIICTTFGAGMTGKFSLTVLGSSAAELAQARQPQAQPIPGKPAFPDVPTTHKQVADIKVRTTDNKHPLQTIGMDSQGRVLALAGPAKSFGAPEKDANSEVHVFGPDGKQAFILKVNFHATSVNGGTDGTIYVAGDGKVARFDVKGKELGVIDLPHMKALLTESDGIRKKAEAQLQQQKDQFAKTVQTFKDRAKVIEDKKEEDRSDLEKRQLTQFKSILKSYEQTEKFYASQSVDTIVAQMTSRLRTINAITVNSKDIFYATGDTQGYGYSIWRTDREFKNPKQILTGIGGCCGQMDIQVAGDGLLIAENTKHRFARYDRDGKELGGFGKRGTGNELDCFGGCCNPMNVCSATTGDIFTAESEGIIKRFSPKGDFLGVVATATMSGGCKNVAFAVTRDEAHIYFLDLPGSRILVMAKTSSK